MPSISTKPNRFYPSIPAITEDTATHEDALRVIKEAIETHERRNSNYLKSSVRFEELIDLGIVNSEGDSVLDRSLKFIDYSVESNSIGVSGNAATLIYSDSQSYELDLEAATGNVTITISGGPPTGTFGEMIVKIQQDTTAARTVTWAGGTFVFPGGVEVEPSSAADSITIFYLSTWDGGTTWYINGVAYG